MKISHVKAIQILDSRGTPTLGVRLESPDGVAARYSVPAGASKGEKEAMELRDGDSAFHGQGVQLAVKLINEHLSKEITTRDFADLQDFDNWLCTLDPSPQKTEVGGNTLLALSGAFAHLSAHTSRQPLWQYFQKISQVEPSFPHIFANLVNGGKHAPGLDVQEFMIVPKSTKPSAAIAEIYDFHYRLQEKLVERYGSSAKLVGDEGGMAPVGAKTEDILEIISSLRGDSQTPAIALDVAASSFYKGGSYCFEGQKLSSQDWSARLSGLASKYKVSSLEDPFAEVDTEAFVSYRALHPKSLVVGDDITVTSSQRIAELARKKAISGVIIKPNQIGTVSEAIAAIKTARDNGLAVIISHRSGETNDHLIIDLAYGFAADAVKIGAPKRGERVEKYNRLLEIEEGIE